MDRPGARRSTSRLTMRRAFRSGLSPPSPSSGCFSAPRASRERVGLSWSVMRFYVTTPIYYVNDRPHIGHSYTTIAADILARHQRQRGAETFFLTGVDEHATKVWRAAEKQGVSAQEFVDHIAETWRALPERLNAETDFFIRTTDEGHKAFVRQFLQRIYDNGDVYEDVYSGPYCVSCEEFKNEDELVDGK